MASKKVQDFAGRNVGKSVEVELTTGRTFKGVLQKHVGGFTIKSGHRGRPPVFGMEDVKNMKRYSEQPQAERGTRTTPQPQITRPINTTKESLPKESRKAAVKKPQSKSQSKPQSHREPTSAELAEAEKIAEAALADL